MRWTAAILTLCLACLSGVVSSEEALPEILRRADAALANRDFAQCLPDYAIVLKEYEKQNNQKGIADLCYKIGRANRKLGRFEEADQYLNRARKLHEQLGDREAAGLDLTEYAVSRQRVGSYDEALKLSEQALAINLETGNKDALARTLENFANTYYRLGQYPKAIEYFQRAIPTGRESGNKEAEMFIWENLGQVYFAMSDYEKALECYEEAKRLVTEIGDPRLFDTIYGNEALVFWNLGDLEKARETLQRVLQLFQESGQKQHIANTYENLGSLEMELGNYGESQQALLKSYQLAVELKDQGLAAVSLNALGNLHKELGNFDLAQDYFTRAYGISEETGERREAAGSLVYLGQIAHGQKQYQTALENYRKALQVFVELGDEQRVAVSKEAIGSVYGELGDHDLEMEYYRAALSLNESIGDRLGVASCNLRIGSAYYAGGKLAEADAALARAVEMLGEVGNQALLWRALYRRGLVCRDTGKTSESIGFMKKAVEIIEGIRGTMKLAEQKWSYLEDKVSVYEDLVELLLKSQDTAGAFEFVERSRARAFLDLLSESRINPDRALNSKQYVLKRRILAKLMDLNERIEEEYQKNAPDRTAIADLKQKQSRLDEDYLKLMVEIREQNPRYENLQRPEPLKIEQARLLLDTNSAIAEFLVGRKQSALFLITSTGSQSFILPGEEVLSRQVLTLLKAIQKRSSNVDAEPFRQYRETAALLYENLLKPAESLLQGKGRIILVPDGPLNYLPFESLLTAEASAASNFAKLPYLVLQYDIQYVPSVSVLSALRRDPGNRPARDLIAFGDPTGVVAEKDPAAAKNALFRDWTDDLQSLPFARAEVKAISALFPNGQVAVFMNRDASEYRVKRAPLGEYRIVHFASHGLIDEERPQFSSLVLSPGDYREDGFLTMREVFDLKLNADLVVLSACKSGLGKRIRGEGLAGLSMAFFSAGSSNVLASLWDVYDRSTAEFMTAFYKNLRKSSMDKAGALRAARLQMIEEGRFAHPYSWAPFILIGAN